MLVPEVIGYEHRHDALGLSIMLTTEIQGEPLSRLARDVDVMPILAAVGRDLALINSAPVAGFGWIDRAPPAVTALAAARPDNRTFLLDGLSNDLALLTSRGLAATEREAIERVIARADAWLDAPHGWLAHGDFDRTHIYQRDGRYTGIIDFGEMRGAARLYDLGHFALRAQESPTPAGLAPLLAGYATVSALPDDAEGRIALASLLIGVRSLARGLRKGGAAALTAGALRGVRHALAQLASA